jgi:hypothetical protein
MEEKQRSISRKWCKSLYDEHLNPESQTTNYLEQKRRPAGRAAMRCTAGVGLR